MRHSAFYAREKHTVYLYRTEVTAIRARNGLVWRQVGIRQVSITRKRQMFLMQCDLLNEFYFIFLRKHVFPEHRAVRTTVC